MTDLITMTHSAWLMLQPYLPLMAARAAEELGKQAPAAVGRLWQAISARFEAKDAAKEALQDLLKAPADADLQAAFRVQLKKLLAEDADFAAAVAHLVTEAAPTYNATLTGGGAIAQGDGAKAVGAGGTLIEGGVNTGGGAYVGGSVDTSGGDFTGRDRKR